MKRYSIVALLALLIVVVPCIAQDQPQEASDEETQEVSNDVAEVTAYRADTATILKLFGNIRDFRGSGGTQVQAKARERKLKETLAQINARYKGTRLTLQRAELSDVIANDEITHFGFLVDRSDWEVPGKYTATYYIPLPKKVEDSTLYRGGIAIGQSKYNDDGTTVYEEFRQGLPNGQLDFESFKYLIVKIVKTFPNEKSVINLQKGSVAPLTGKIREVLYSDIGDELTIWID